MLPIEYEAWRRITLKQERMDQELLGAGRARQRDGTQLANQVDRRCAKPELLFQFRPHLRQRVRRGFHIPGDDTPQSATGRNALTASRDADLPAAAEDGEHDLGATHTTDHDSECLVGYPQVMVCVALEIATLSLIQNFARPSPMRRDPVTNCRLVDESMSIDLAHERFGA